MTHRAAAPLRRLSGLRRVRLLLAVGAVAGILAGCSHPITDFHFQAGSQAVALHSSRSLPAGHQGLFLQQEHGRSASPARQTVLYSLSKPQGPPRANMAFYLEYRSTAGPLELHLSEEKAKSGPRTESTARLPSLKRPTAGAARSKDRAPGDPIRFLYPVARGTKILAFQVTSTSPHAEVQILGAGFAANAQEVARRDGALTIHSGILLSGTAFDGPPRGGSNDTTIVRFPSLVAHLGNAQAQIALTYSYHPAPGDIRLDVKGSKGNHQRYLIQPRPGRHSLYLYTASTGFTPDQLELSTANAGFTLEAVSVHPFPTPQTTSFDGATKPIPADIGAILSYQTKWWRQKEYELFSWNLIPSVLIMEFESYKVQARFMKRFAFFIEKQGYVGKLWTNKQLAGLHGWNAHDYRPEDLARFYTTAAKEDFTLNPEEIQLRKILLANGVIKQSGKIYAPGAGAILTFAHVGPLWLRSLLLTHEGYHGIFFTHPQYRKAVFSIWDSAPAGEREVFRYLFLPYFRYDVSDIYLVKNEFQAYLMEQPLDQTKRYFRDQIAAEMGVMKSPIDSQLAAYAKAHPDMFYRSAEKVQRAVEQAVGVPAGDLVGLRPD